MNDNCSDSESDDDTDSEKDAVAFTNSNKSEESDDLMLMRIEKLEMYQSWIGKCTIRQQSHEHNIQTSQGLIRKRWLSYTIQELFRYGLDAPKEYAFIWQTTLWHQPNPSFSPSTPASGYGWGPVVASPFLSLAPPLFLFPLFPISAILHPSPHSTFPTIFRRPLPLAFSLPPLPRAAPWMLRLPVPVHCCSRSGSLSSGSRCAAPLPCFDLLIGLQICAVASFMVGGGLASRGVVFRLRVTHGWGLLTELPGGGFWSPVG
ncbi:uncharacterized protein LOC126631305 [Malus sylvestris]|uniref:uncharacterized protein LOC126631305 n=1 Tax=Malus sylvestris TaxID=3752 RepID=UPI0021AC74DF|nr:uncharacterized protein LOC126631305 [Malus sylvestris]